MSDIKTKPGPKPFHEAIVDFIAQADENDMVAAGSIIKLTIIPKGHEAIKEAWEARLVVLAWQGIDYGVPAYLDEQKAAAEAKKTAGKQSAKDDGWGRPHF